MHLDGSPQQVRQILGNGQTQTHAMHAAEGCVPLPGEGLKDLLEEILPDTDARVPHDNPVDGKGVGQLVVLHSGDEDAAAVWRIGHSVVGQIHHQLAQLLPVAVNGVVAHFRAVQRKGKMLLLRLREQELPDLSQNIPQAAGALLRPRLVGVRPGELENLVDHIQQLAAAGLNPVQVACGSLPVVQTVPGQGGIAEDGVEGGPHVVGHIGEEGVFGRDGQLRVAQRLLQLLFLFHLPPELFIHPAASHDDLRGRLLLAYVNKPHLKILDLPPIHHPVIQTAGGSRGQLFPDAFRVGFPDHPRLILRMHPGQNIFMEVFGIILAAAGLAESRFHPAAEAVRQNFPIFQVHIENGIIIDAQSLDNLQTAQVFLPHLGPFPVVLLRTAEQLLFAPLLFLEQAGVLRPAAFHFLGSVRQKYVKNIPYQRTVDKMTVILNPAHDAVPSDDAVLHIIQVPLLFPDLPPDAGLHAVQVLRMHHSAEGASGHREKFLQALTLENPQQPLIGIDDLLSAVRPVDQKSSGHLSHEVHNIPGRPELSGVHPDLPAAVLRLLGQRENALNDRMLPFLHSGAPFRLFFCIIP